ncbi:glucose dehydrogenase [Cypionkella aquatica]|uniref:Glucose dehydrogenase n=1 Tax=Cypionkella aquatica TaxID=1756042 RepID=A0AA37U270_9RHOB|nr:PQQ-dependent sugar dehydrogenase [Cypionkella aquatica]GLS86140.1 glucose dehydrogenase [Cypionkella aquatica]
MLNFRDMTRHKGNKFLKSPLLRGLAVTLAGVTATAGAAVAQQPVETRAPNGVGQTPQRADQTRAPQPDTLTTVDTQVIAADLPPLWAMEFLPDGRMLTTVKAGALRIVAADGSLGPEITGLPEVDGRGQGGLLDVALSPQFETDGQVFFSYAEPRDDGNGTAVASGKLVLDEAGGGRLEDVRVIFRQTPSHSGNAHFGSRLVFGAQGELFVTVGERSDAATRQQAQDPASGFGKVFRIDASGAALGDNPFVALDGALPQVWSLGHRNMQAAALDDKGRLWTVEHGPRGGDELNRPEAGLNYGWPEVTYGIDYSGANIGDGITATAATEQPVYYWDPVIAPSGMTFYQGDEFPEWNGAFLVGGLVSQGVVVLHMKDDRVAYEQQISLGERVRDVKLGQDGAVYVVTDGRSGASQILRLTKA